jgi:hypothetical protein
MANPKKNNYYLLNTLDSVGHHLYIYILKFWKYLTHRSAMASEFCSISTSTWSSVNVCALREGTVPKCFKSGIITPVYKKQDTPINNHNSYRRITVSSVIGNLSFHTLICPIILDSQILYLIYNCYDKSLQFLYNLVEQIFDTLHWSYHFIIFRYYGIAYD